MSQAAKQIWQFGSLLSRGVWGSPAIFRCHPHHPPPPFKRRNKRAGFDDLDAALILCAFAHGKANGDPWTGNARLRHVARCVDACHSRRFMWLARA